MTLNIAGKITVPLEVMYDASMSHIGATLKATFPMFDSKHITKNVNAELGDSVILQDESDTPFRGSVTSISATGSKMTVTAHDTWYQMNKSKMIIQFADGITVRDAIIEVLKRLGYHYSPIPIMKAVVDATYYIQTPAEIIKSLVSIEENTNGGEYYYTTPESDALGIRSVGSISCGVPLSAYISPSRNISLDDVKNRITALVSDGNGYTELETVVNAESVSQYGDLADYEKISEEDASSAAAIVYNKLQKVCRPIEEGEITVAGDWRLTAVGQRIAVQEPITGLRGDYIITAVSHRLGDDFKTTLSLRKYRQIKKFKTVIVEDRTNAMLTFKESRLQGNR